MKYKKKYGLDVYLVGGFIILVNIAVIVAKFFGKDVGIAIPDAIASIQKQSEWIAIAYMVMRTKKQTNLAHQRVNKIKQDKLTSISKAEVLP